MPGKKSKLQIKLIKKGITQSEIARLAGVSDMAVSLVLQGKSQSAKISQVINNLLENIN